MQIENISQPSRATKRVHYGSVSPALRFVVSYFDDAKIMLRISRKGFIYIRVRMYERRGKYMIHLSHGHLTSKTCPRHTRRDYIPQHMRSAIALSLRASYRDASNRRLCHPLALRRAMRVCNSSALSSSLDGTCGVVVAAAATSASTAARCVAICRRKLSSMVL